MKMWRMVYMKKTPRGAKEEISTVKVGLMTLVFLGVFTKTCVFGVKRINDDLMHPTFKQGRANNQSEHSDDIKSQSLSYLTRVKDRLSKMFLSDVVLYDKWSDCNELQLWRNRYVAIRDPNSNKILIRKIIAVAGQWIKRKDDGGLIKIPNCHLWIECDGYHHFDSINPYGPISSKHVIGEARYVIWPPWRFAKVKDISKFQMFKRSNLTHSKIYSESEINRLYNFNSE